MKRLLCAALVVLLTGCLGYPDGVRPVQDFEAERYLGTWYEIARLDHWFEEDLERVTATYGREADGSISVINRGYLPQPDRWSEARGRARFVRSPEEGYLKVSFFGPFYASYVVFELDREGYGHAFVSGNNQKYLWLLARTPTVAPEVMAEFREKAQELGFDLADLIIVKQG